MNEPSVFNGPEVTMLKDAIHHGGWEHRTVHNLYALLHTKGTYEGLMKRSDNTLRPFVLTRGHYSGTQRYAAVWTGDNTAEWGHLAMSIKMCLSLSVAGISFCGADVGGFFGYPGPELMTRWYQAAAFQPFMRAHSHIDTKRREPWLYPVDTTHDIRQAVRLRYTYLPLWYTIFYEHMRSGTPVMKPLLALYPQETECYHIDNEYILGDSLLVRPVVEAGATTADIYFPGHEIWYDIETYKQYIQHGIVNVPANIHKIPVYQRGGTIVPRKMIIRRASTLMHDDPFTLVVCLDVNKQAWGTLYIDDGESFEYLQKSYSYIKFQFANNSLTSGFIDKDTAFATEAWLERVIIAGVKTAPNKIVISNKESKKTELLFTHDKAKELLTIKKPGFNIVTEFQMNLVY